MKWWLVLMMVPNDAPQDAVVLRQSYPTLEACQERLDGPDEGPGPELTVVAACVADKNFSTSETSEPKQ